MLPTTNLLGRIIVVDDINEASRVARDNGFRSKVVTLDGRKTVQNTLITIALRGITVLPRMRIYLDMNM